jgi:hypothetical protein
MEEIREQRVIAPRIEGWWDVELSRRRGGAPPAR